MEDLVSIASTISLFLFLIWITLVLILFFKKMR